MSLIHLINKNAFLDCTIVKFYIKELNDCLASIEDVIFGLTVSLFLSWDNLFCAVSRIATCADMSITKANRSAKTGLVRCLVSKSHGSEVCNCCVQRFFFFLLAGSRSRLRLRRSQSQLRYEKKPSGTQGSDNLKESVSKENMISIFSRSISVRSPPKLFRRLLRTNLLWYSGPSYMVSGTRDNPSPEVTLSSVYM